MQQNELAIPLYLDTKSLLDLLASMEGGFSMMERVTTHSTGSKTTEIGADAGFGVGNLFNIFKLDLGGSAKKAKMEQEGKEYEKERYHPTAPC